MVTTPHTCTQAVNTGRGLELGLIRANALNHRQAYLQAQAGAQAQHSASHQSHVHKAGLIVSKAKQRVLVPIRLMSPGAPCHTCVIMAFYLQAWLLTTSLRCQPPSDGNSTCMHFKQHRQAQSDRAPAPGAYHRPAGASADAFISSASAGAIAAGSILACCRFCSATRTACGSANALGAHALCKPLTPSRGASQAGRRGRWCVRQQRSSGRQRGGEFLDRLQALQRGQRGRLQRRERLARGRRVGDVRAGHLHLAERRDQLCAVLANLRPDRRIPSGK